MFSDVVKKIDGKKALQMLLGIIGINVSFLLGGIMYERITNVQYLNTETNNLEYFRITSGYIMLERAINWWLGLVYQHFTLPKENRVKISTENSAAAGFLIWLSSITTTQSMYFVSYPLIIMAKSCSLLSVILVGIFCSRVRSKELKLSSQKIIIAIIVTIGIIMFKVFDPRSKFESDKSPQIFGLVLLVASLFADGFIPDLQAQIKDKFKPSPIQMLIKINKWCAICSFIHLIVMSEMKNFVIYTIYHPGFVQDLLIMSLAAFIGQIFIYRMIKEFKQHTVPFVVTTRKILTVGLSIIYFKHQTNWGQISSIAVVFIVTVYEFIDNIRKSDTSGSNGKLQSPKDHESTNLKSLKQQDSIEMDSTGQSEQSTEDEKKTYTRNGENR